MSTITFDTHKFVRRLVDEGASEKQAQAHVEALQEALVSHAQASAAQLATKEDVAILRAEMREMELRLTLRLGAIVAAGIAATAAIAKFL